MRFAVEAEFSDYRRSPPIYARKGKTMDHDEIEAGRALLSSKPRPVGWAERRQRIDEVRSVWSVAGDVTLAAVDLGGMPGEWSIVPGSKASRVIMFLHGGGYCSDFPRPRSLNLPNPSTSAENGGVSVAPGSSCRKPAVASPVILYGFERMRLSGRSGAATSSNSPPSCKTSRPWRSGCWGRRPTVVRRYEPHRSVIGPALPDTANRSELKASAARRAD
jgi:hypothetical protein